MSRPHVVLLASILMLTACSGEVSLENYSAIENGMSRAQVIGLLGEPDREKTVGLAGVSGAHLAWNSDDAVISVQFVNGEAFSKQYVSTEQ